MSFTRRTVALVLALLGAAQLAVVTSAAAQAIITNGTVTLGVNRHGQLNVPGPASPIADTVRVGLRYNANGWEALSHGSPCEGWGVGVASVGITGWANECFGGLGDGGPVFGLTLNSFTFTGDRATSLVTVKNPFPPFQDLLRVTHDWMPSFWPNLYQANVRITNANGGWIGSAGTPIGDIRYRRVMDWDIEPTRSEDFVTIGGLDAGHVPSFFLFSSDDGFELADPLRFEFGSPFDLHEQTQRSVGVTNPVPCGFSRNFIACGRFLAADGEPMVTDHGALFDLAFPALAPDAAHEFALFYGAAATREEAELALYMVGAEIYSLANCRPLELGFGGFAGCDTATGAPTTFIFAMAGVGGSPVFGDISGMVYQDLNRNGVYDAGTDTPAGGVTLMALGTNLAGATVTRTVTSRTDGFYVFEAMPRGSYSVSSVSASGSLVRTTVSPLAVTVGGSFPYVMQVDFGYVAAAALRGTVYTDGNSSGGLDAPDTRLAGVTITVSGPGGTRTTTTGSDGTFGLDGLTPGTYTVSAPASVGGEPLLTPSPMTLALGAGQQGWAYFGYRRSLAAVTSISGTVFTDVSRNRAFNTGIDTPLAGVTVTLRGPSRTLTATTGADGTYAFTGLSAGRYRLSAPRGVGGMPDVTQNPVMVTLTSGQQRVVNFGYKRPPMATLHGVVFMDVTGNREFNGRKDTPLAGLAVTLTGPGRVTRTVVTGAGGTYAFADLPPGVYTVGVPSSVNGQPVVTRNPTIRYLHGGHHKVNFAYKAAPQKKDKKDKKG